ncbi:MAG: LysM peptidoglycan-binding domain-containing protein [Pseudomonadota bacterium]
MILKRSTRKLFFCLLILTLVPVQNAVSQDDLTEDLEAELEAEIGLSEEDLTSQDDESFEDFDEDADSSESEASESTSSSEEDDFEKAMQDEVTDEEVDSSEFSEEDFDDEFAEEEAASEKIADEEFSEDDFDDEDFGEEGFEDFDDFADEQPAADETVPIDESFGDTDLMEEPAVEMTDDQAPEDLEFQEQPSQEEQAFDQAPPVQDFEDVSSGGPTEPNLEYEAKLYDIYVNYHASPTPNLEWQSLVGERRSEIYSISSGDTLWGISETFFGDGNYWPKVWSLNSSIKNPHLIQPSNRIAFVMGTETDAPMFTVTEPEASEDDQGEAPEGEAPAVPEELSEKDIEDLIEAGALSAQDTEQLQEMIEKDEAQDQPSQEMADSEPEPESDVPDIDIPPPGIISRPVLKRLPPSVPEWQSADPDGIYDDVGIDYGVRKITRLKDTLYLQSFVDDSPDNSEAVVVETQQTGYFGSDLEFVYVKFPKGRARLGRKYLVVSPKGKIRPSLDSVRTTDLGYQKRISGLVTLQNRVEASVGSKHELYKAIINKAVNPIEIGGQLLRGDLPIVNLEASGPRSTTVAMVIGGTGGERQFVFGKSSIIYLNRGSKEGVRVGQILDIRANRRSRSRDTIVLEAQRVIGQVKIVKTASRFSTGVVLRSDDPIMAGDLTGEGRYQPRGRNQLAKASGGGSFDSTAEEAVDDEELEGLLDDAEFGEDGEGSDLESDF